MVGGGYMSDNECDPSSHMVIRDGKLVDLIKEAKKLAMKMPDEIEAVIEEYALAHMDAHKNAQLLCDSHYSAEECTRVSNECADRMKRVAKADKALFDFWAKGRIEELPQPAKEFLLAELDRGCPTCWLRSSTKPDPVHGDVCFKKIKNWFRCRTNLIRFGAENLLNRSAE